MEQEGEKPIIILFSHSYPFGKGEEFLENEILSASGRNDILVISYSKEEKATRAINSLYGVERVGKSFSWHKKIRIVLSAFFRISFVKEVFFLLKQNKWRRSRIKACINFAIHAEIVGATLEVVLKRIGKRKVVLYSYWFWFEALASVHTKKKHPNIIKVISRAHGFDLYPIRHSNHYLPFRRYLSSNIDELHFVSKNGKDFFMSTFGLYAKTKIFVSRLGAFDHGIGVYVPNHKEYHIVSCCYLVPVKRIELLCCSLSKIHNVNIVWTHIGGGPMFEKITEQAKENLGDKKNIKYEFMGNMTNEEVLTYYKKTQIDLFVSVSSSEGVPVSMMEASSFGIPILSTNVGGVSEIVNSENGYLVPPDIDPQTLSDAMVLFFTLPEEEIKKLRKNAREKWRSVYNAEKNYEQFYNTITTFPKVANKIE